MDPEGLLPCSHEPLTGTYRELDESNQDPHTHCFQLHYLSVYVIYVYVFKAVFFLQDLGQSGRCSGCEV